MKMDYVLQTKIRQTITAIASLGIGSGIIALSIFAVRPVGVWKSEIVVALFGGVGLLLIVWHLSTEQFERGWAGLELLKKGSMFAFWVGMFLGILCTGSIVFPDFDLKIYLVGLLSILLSFPLLGAAVGSILALSLVITKFSSDVHRHYMSNQAVIEACKSGQLPYRHKIRFFWQVIYYILGAMFVIGIGIALVLDNGNVLNCLVSPIIASVLLAGANIHSNVLIRPRIRSVQGRVGKTSRRTRRRTIWILRCEGETLLTDSYLWGQILQGEVHTLWYVSVGKRPRVIAYELLSNRREPQELL